MPCRSRPEAEEAPPRGDTTQRVRTIECWLHHAEEELLYAPDAQGETAGTPLDARYYLRWGGGGLGVLAILRFPMDARHPLTQQSYGAYAVGDVFPFTSQGQRVSWARHRAPGIAGRGPGGAPRAGHARGGARAGRRATVNRRRIS